MLSPAEQARMHAQCTIAHAAKCVEALSRFWVGRLVLLAAVVAIIIYFL